MMRDFDVIIIGSGVVGSAAARELSRYRLRIGVLEKNPDVCLGTSGRNSAVVHAGFNSPVGSKMARFCVAGNAGFDKLAEELDIPFKRTGKLVVGFSENDMDRLIAMKKAGIKNGVPGLEIVDRAFIDKVAPAVKGDFALWSGSTGIVDPFRYTLALAENAALNGVEFFFEHEVTAIKTDDCGNSWTVTAGDEVFKTRWVINCAGLYSDVISSMLGIDGYKLHPCKGEYYVLDKKLAPMLPVPAYPLPDPVIGVLGIHLTPTTGGSIIVGPSNEFLDERDNYACESDVMDMLIADGSRIFPHIRKEHFIRNYCGIRPKLDLPDGASRDFIIERRDDIAPHAVNLVGIESPGLTSAVPIAHEIIRLMNQVESFDINENFDPRSARPKAFRSCTPEEQAALIASDPDYGEIICRCETITKAEILAAINNPLGVHTMTGVKYRTHAMLGRCQSGYCQMRIAELIMSETGLSPEEIRYSGEGSYMFTGEVRSDE